MLPNGDFYQGCYFRGLRNSKGLYVFKNGARYEGAIRKKLINSKSFIVKTLFNLILFCRRMATGNEIWSRDDDIP